MLKKHSLPFILSLLAMLFGTSAAGREVHLTLLETSDVHGNFFPIDFLRGGVDGSGSLARVATYVEQLRAAQGEEAVVLLDNGDILQGQPSAYYYNVVNTDDRHLCADIFNFMRYDAVTMGNHDVEAGHEVYDRWTQQCEMPVLGANVVRTDTGEPYLPPYVVLERQGVRIAVLGLVTPGIPLWLPENLWSGLRFDDMEATARKYMPEMRQKADIVVGLFHSGVGRSEGYAPLTENASAEVAQRVAGFDIVFCGHDHRRANQMLRTAEGGAVLLLNPAADAHAVAKAEVTLRMTDDGMKLMEVRGDIVEVDALEPSPVFVKAFKRQCKAVKAFTAEAVGRCAADMTTLPAFFGPSAFVDFIHEMQLEISGADISFAAPLAFDASIPRGTIRVSDLFNLYRYENMLYVMELSGREVKDYLEFSYAGWVQTMSSAADHLLLFRENAAQLPDAWQRLKTPNFNFDSAAGIRYTVDVARPAGSRVKILSMADGSPFDEAATYRCALNSYRGNGGGRHLTEGAGIAPEQLKHRIVWATDKDLRYYMMQRIRSLKKIHPRPLNLWKFIPEDWAEEAKERDAELLKSQK